jgi:hypothetical protein
MYPRGRLANLFERDLDAAPKQLSMRCRHREKWLNENLAPLRRFLRTQVGRPWDLVRSDIAAHLRRTSAVQAHVFEHLADYVRTDVTLVEGIPHGGRYGRFEPLYCVRGRMLLWVCPRTGLLREAAPEPKAAPRIGRHLRMSASVELREIDGVFRHVGLHPFRETPKGTIQDALAGRLDATWFGYGDRYQRTFRRNDAYAVEVAPLGLREIALVRARFGSRARVR